MHLAETLIALGGAFLAAGLTARLGRRVGLPTIPLFMLAGLLLGPAGLLDRAFGRWLPVQEDPSPTSRRTESTISASS